MDTKQPLDTNTVRERTIARAAVVQALFQCEQGKVSPEEVISQFKTRRADVLLGFEEGASPGADVKLFELLFKQAWEEQAENDLVIKELLPETWSIERLDPVLRASLRAALTELRKGLPRQVVINEYLDVVNSFLHKDVSSMLNGILDKAAKNYKKAQKSPT